LPDELHLSAYTVQGDLKSMFTKTVTGDHRELVRRLISAAFPCYDQNDYKESIEKYRPLIFEFLLLS
jgi:hypothetical protein